LSGLVLAILAGLTPAPAGAAEVEAPPRVYVGIYLNDITKFEQKDGVFDVDFVMWAKWLGTFTKDALTIANAANVRVTQLGEQVDGPWHSARWQVKGTLRGEFPVHGFPFDEQTVAVILELPATAGELVPDLISSGMRSRFSVTGWNYAPLFRPRLMEETYRSDLGQIPTEGEPTKVQRLGYEVTLRRPAVAVGLKFFLPLVIIAMVAMVALFIHPSVAAARASIGVTSLLSCFAFQFAVANSMPSVSYVTLADKVFIVAYAFCLVALGITVAAHSLHQAHREALSLTLDRRARLALPLAALVAVAVVSVGQSAPPSEPPRRPAAAVVAPVPASVRDVARLGTTTMSPVGATQSIYGGGWRPAGDETPAHLEELPSVSSDSLRLLAGGNLEVRWRLKPGLRWSDGHAATAADIAFAYRVSPHPNVIDVRTESEVEAVLVWNDRLAEALAPPAIRPQHALQATFQRGGYDAVEKQVRETVTPVLGPYRVAGFVAGQTVTLERNPHHAGPAAPLARVEVRRYADGRALAAAFEAGAVDLTVPSALSVEEALDLQRRRPDAVQIRTSATHLFLQPDLTHPLLGRRDVRRALLQAIDRAAILREVHGGVGAVAHVPRPGPLPPGAVEHVYDPARARAALQAAGAVGATIPLFFRPQATERLTAERIAASLRAVGLTVDLRPTDDLAPLFRKGTHGGLVSYSMRGDEDARPAGFWNLAREGGRGVTTARNDAFDDAAARLLGREAHALFPERRSQLRTALAALYSDRLPFLPLLFASERLVADPALRGWDPGARGSFGRTIARWHFVAPGGAPASAPAAGAAQGSP